MAIKLEGAQLLLYRAAANADRRLPSAYETAIAKAACNQAGFEVASEAVQIMITEVRSLTALTGYRGKPKGDLEAVAHAVVAISRLAEDASVAEAEINPLIVQPAGEGVIAVDALVRLMV